MLIVAIISFGLSLGFGWRLASTFKFLSYVDNKMLLNGWDRIYYLSFNKNFYQGQSYRMKRKLDAYSKGQIRVRFTFKQIACLVPLRMLFLPTNWILTPKQQYLSGYRHGHEKDMIFTIKRRPRTSQPYFLREIAKTWGVLERLGL